MGTRRGAADNKARSNSGVAALGKSSRLGPQRNHAASPNNKGPMAHPGTQGDPGSVVWFCLVLLISHFLPVHQPVLPKGGTERLEIGDLPPVSEPGQKGTQNRGHKAQKFEFSEN